VYRIIFLALFSLLLSSCGLNKCTDISREKKVTGVQSSDFLGYQPIAPMPALYVLYYNRETDEFERKKWASFPENASGKKEKKSLLPLQSSYTYIATDDMSGGLSFLSNGASAAIGNYAVTSDYILYRVEQVEEAGIGLIGVGMRIRAKVHTLKENLNIGGFFNLAMEVQAGNATGELQVDSIGIVSPEIIQLFPALATEINPTSIQNVMQALAAIKAKISEDDVGITPHLLAFQQIKTGKKKAIINSLAYESGLRAGNQDSEKIKLIVGYVGSDSAKWDALVDASELDTATKLKWKAVEVRTIENKLRNSAAVSSDILHELFKAMQ